MDLSNDICGDDIAFKIFHIPTGKHLWWQQKGDSHICALVPNELRPELFHTIFPSREAADHAIARTNYGVANLEILQVGGRPGKRISNLSLRRLGLKLWLLRKFWTLREKWRWRHVEPNHWRLP